MNNVDASKYRSTLALCIGFCTALTPFVASAQDAPKPAAAPAAPAEPAAAPAAVPTPAPAEAPKDAAPVVVAPAPAAAVAAPAPAAVVLDEKPADAPPPPPPPEPTSTEEKLPSIDVGAWLRVGIRFQNGTNPKKLDDQSFDTAYGELHLGGKVHKNVSYTLNFNVNALAGNAGLMDAIIGLDFQDELHLWSGQLLVPSDRANFAGPFFMSPWNYPGVYSVGKAGGFLGPAEGPAGRNVGSVLWGDFGQGLFKYYGGIFNLAAANVNQSPLFTGRLNFSPIGKEPGFYHNADYYGEKDILAIGVGAQSQKNGSVSSTGVADNFKEFNADVLAAFNIGDAGTITAEGAYYHFGGKYNFADNGFYVLASYLSPQCGVGKFEPMVRYQAAMKSDTPAGDVTASITDAQVAYVVKGPNLRFIANFQHTNLGVDKQIGNALQFGIQTIQF